MLTEEDIANWLKKQKKEDENNMKKQKTKTVDDYIIQSEEEWKDILKYHNVSYYPRFEKKQAEETYQLIRSYFNKKDNKPSFCSVPTKVVKLEKKLDELNKKLLLTEGLNKKEGIVNFYIYTDPDIQPSKSVYTGKTIDVNSNVKKVSFEEIYKTLELDNNKYTYNIEFVDKDWNMSKEQFDVLYRKHNKWKNMKF